MHICGSTYMCCHIYVLPVPCDQYVLVMKLCRTMAHPMQ